MRKDGINMQLNTEAWLCLAVIGCFLIMFIFPDIIHNFVVIPRRRKKAEKLIKGLSKLSFEDVCKLDKCLKRIKFNFTELANCSRCKKISPVYCYEETEAFVCRSEWLWETIKKESHYLVFINNRIGNSSILEKLESHVNELKDLLI
jgi:hypothetical protein